MSRELELLTELFALEEIKVIEADQYSYDLYDGDEIIANNVTIVGLYLELAYLQGAIDEE